MTQLLAEGGVFVGVGDVAALVREEPNRAQSVGVVEALLASSDEGDQLIVTSDVVGEDGAGSIGFRDDVAERAGVVFVDGIQQERDGNKDEDRKDAA